MIGSAPKHLKRPSRLKISCLNAGISVAVPMGFVTTVATVANVACRAGPVMAAAVTRVPLLHTAVLAAAT